MSTNTLSPQKIRAGWCWMAFQFLLLPSLLTGAAGLLPWEVSDAAVNLGYYLVSVAAISLIFSDFLRNSLRDAIRNPKRYAVVCVLALVVYYFAAWAVTRFIGFCDPAFANRNDASITAMRQQGLVLTAITTVLLAPLSEECLFRGLMFGQILKKSRPGAYALSALCFGLLHVVGYLGTYTPLQLLLSLLQYAPAGLILAWSYEKSETIAVPILVHGIINAVSMVQIL